MVLPHTPPRDWRSAVHLVGPASHIIREYDVTRVISTGASPAPPFFLAAAPHGLEMHYIESATRSHGPSMSGKLVSTIPAVHLYSQYPSWAHGRWHFAGSIFDPFSAAPASDPDHPIRHVVVTLGTETYGFRRALERLIKVLPHDAHVLWQTGCTDTDGLGIRGRESVPGDELRAAIQRADLVVSHAGTGSAITCFELGKTPLILPREARYGEHVDEHQALTADELSRRGLAVAVAVDELTPEHLVLARSGRVVMDDVHRPFELVQPRTALHVHIAAWHTHSRHPRTDGVGITLEIHCPDISCMLQRAVAEATVGSASAAEAELRRVASHKAAGPGHRAQALEALVELLSCQGRHAECAELQRERLSLPFDRPARRLAAQMELIVHLVASGGLEEAVWTTAHWVSQAEAAGVAATYEGVRLRAALADLLRMQGDLISAELQIGLALSGADRLDDPVARASALWNAALVSAEQGRFAEAVHLGRSASDSIQEAGGDLPAALTELVNVTWAARHQPG